MKANMTKHVSHRLPRARLLLIMGLPVIADSLHAQSAQAPAGGREIPVTIKELDIDAAMREFQAFQQRLEHHRKAISLGQKTAAETAQILEGLRQTASAKNGHNEQKILQAIRGYVEGVVAKQVGLVDFLESQRYRISYYANKMAASIRPQDLVVLFGTEEANENALTGGVQQVASAQKAIADFVDALPEAQFDKQLLRARASMPEARRRQLDALLFRYQQARDGQALAKSRLRLVREMQRKGGSARTRAPDVNPDLLLGQMFGSLDRIRLQLSVDLVYLEDFLGRYAQTTRTQEILQAFQQLVEMQGGMAGPSKGLASVLDWLHASSFRRLRIGARSLAAPGLKLPQSSDLLREAYRAAHSQTPTHKMEVNR